VKRPLSLFLGIILIVVVVYLVYEYRGDFGLGGPKSAATPGAGSGEIAWQTVDRSADGFKVKMPAAANETQIPAYTDHGVVEQVEMIEAPEGPDTTYAVAWADNPPVERAAGDDAEKTLDMARDGALGRTQTSLEILARNAGGGILNGRLILAGTHLYMLIATFPSTSARRDENVKHFFDSFSLTAVPQQ
jgi:hypothetical protein